MRIAGLGGGIACGKSTVTAQLRAAGIEVIDCDEIAHAVQRKVRAGEEHQQLRRAAGEALIAAPRGSSASGVAVGGQPCMHCGECAHTPAAHLRCFKIFRAAGATSAWSRRLDPVCCAQTVGTSYTQPLHTGPPHNLCFAAVRPQPPGCSRLPIVCSQIPRPKSITGSLCFAFAPAR